MSKRVLISGAGIAGPTLAYWLARCGFRPTVVERALRRGGQGVDVRGQAIEVAERMGIMPRIRAAAADVIGMSFVDAANRARARIDLQAIQRSYAGAPQPERQTCAVSKSAHCARSATLPRCIVNTRHPACASARSWRPVRH